jgi:hypothetical protein
MFIRYTLRPRIYIYALSQLLCETRVAEYVDPIILRNFLPFIILKCSTKILFSLVASCVSILALFTSCIYLTE